MCDPTPIAPLTCVVLHKSKPIQDVQQAAQSNEPAKPPFHPALQYLALAIGTLERAGCTEDANAFMHWSICHFDQEDFTKAFAKQKEDLPPFTTAEADIEFAQECLQKIERELRREELQHDTVNMWKGELHSYYEWLRVRKEREVAEQQRKKAEEEQKALNDTSRC